MLQAEKHACKGLFETTALLATGAHSACTKITFLFPIIESEQKLPFWKLYADLHVKEGIDGITCPDDRWSINDTVCFPCPIKLNLPESLAPFHEVSTALFTCLMERSVLIQPMFSS